MNNTDRRACLSVFEKLAQTHKEYRRVVSDVAKANSQEQEVDALLSWYDILTHDVIHGVIDTKTGELARYDHDTKHPQTYIYSWDEHEERGLHTTSYAGGLDETGAEQNIKSAVYNTTFADLYAEVIQLVAYTHYNIKRMYHNEHVVVPVSACTPQEQREYYNAQ